MYAHSVIKLLLDLGALEEWPAAGGGQFVDGLVEALPTLVSTDAPIGNGRPSGAFARRSEGTWLGHVLEHVAIELQKHRRRRMCRSQTRSTGRARVYTVVYDTRSAMRDRSGRTGDRIALLAAAQALRTNGALPADWNWKRSATSTSLCAAARARSLDGVSVKAAEDATFPGCAE